MKTVIFYLYCAYELAKNAIFNLGKVKRWNEEGKFDKVDQFYENIYQNEATNVLKVTGMDVVVEGQENIPLTGPVVFISNHQGNFDVIVLVSTIRRRVGCIVKKELEKVFLLGTWIKLMGCLFIDRRNIKQSAQVITEAIEYIKSGNAMLIFPEGTRSRSNTVGEFKAGSFKIAIKSGAKIVPISIRDSFKAMEENGGKIKSSKIKIKYHEPIETSGLSKEEASALHERVKEIIVAGVGELVEN